MEVEDRAEPTGLPPFTFPLGQACRFGTYLTSYAKAKSKWNFVPQTAESKLEFCDKH